MVEEIFFRNITSSEGILSRYSEICKNLTFQNYKRSQLHKIIQDKIGLTNEKVRERHIFLMEGFNLLSSVKTMNGLNYHLGKNGKLLNAMNLMERLNKRNLHIKEKVLFLNVIFNTITLQISILFKTMIDNVGANRDSIILQYFKEIKKYNIWSEKTINRGINKWEQDKIMIRSFENRYRCMEMWLEDLDIIKRDRNVVKITRPGYNLKSFGYDDINIEKVIRIYNVKNLKEVNINSKKDYDLLKKYILNYYLKIKEPTGFADIQAIFDALIIEFAINEKMKYNKLYNERLLSLLWKDNMISTMSNDEKGNLRYLVLKT